MSDKIKKYHARWLTCFETMGKFKLYTPWWISKATADNPTKYVVVAAFKAKNVDDVYDIIINSYYQKKPVGIMFYFIEERREDWEPTDVLGCPKMDENSIRYWARPEYRHED